jgi:PPM family protein phosphatase
MDTQGFIRNEKNDGPGYQVGGVSDKGPTRSENQDAFWIPDLEIDPQKGSLFLVADGVGGQESGADAARLAVQTARQVFFEARQNDAVVQDALKTALQQANQTVYEESQRREVRRMGATFVAAVVEQNQLKVAHVGDARAYLIRQGEMRQLTRDDTWVQRQVEEGWITQEQAAKHEYRNVVTQVLGNKPEVNVHLSKIHELQQDDVILLCSDGLYDALSESHMLPVLTDNTPQNAAQQLIEDAIKAEATDNITAVVIRIAGTRLLAAEPTVALTMADEPTLPLTMADGLAAALTTADEPTLPPALADEPTLPPPPPTPAAPLPSKVDGHSKIPNWLIILAFTAIILIIAALLVFWLRSRNLDATVETAAGGDMTAVALEATPSAEFAGALKPLPTEAAANVEQPTEMVTDIPPPTPTSMPTPTLAATPEPRGCVNDEVFAYVWTRLQIETSNCDTTPFELEIGQEVLILEETVLTSDGSCGGAPFIRIQSVADTDLEGWIDQGAIDRLAPGESCSP